MMMKQLIATAAFLSAATTAQAVTFTFDAGDGNGTGFQQIDEPGGFGLTMAGANTTLANSFDDISTFSATAAVNAVYEVSWSYFSFDAGGPVFDPFGSFVGSDFFQLTDNGGDAFQFGTFQLDVMIGDVFGFFIDSTDDVEGASNAFVSGQKISLNPSVSVVPLPASGLLLMAGLGGLALRRRKA